MTGWPEGDPAKVKLVAAVRTQTNIPPAWMAPHLVMGSWTQSLKSARLVAEAGTFEKLALPLIHVCFSSG